MIAEIFTEIGKDIVGAPGKEIAEVVQFLVLVGLIWVIGFGFGSRRGFIANMLSERRKHVGEQLQEAAGADERLEHATDAARQREVAAQQEADRLISEAEQGAEQSDQQVRTDADAEATRILDRAHSALDNERAQMQADLREQLVELVSQASRAVMNEKLTVAEQRARIEEAIVDGVTSATESAEADARPNSRRKASGLPRVAASAGSQ